MYTKGVKKAKESKEKKTIVKENTIKNYAVRHGYDIKAVREALEFFPKEMKKLLTMFEKSMS